MKEIPQVEVEEQQEPKKQKLNKTQKKARNRELRIERKKAGAKDKRKEIRTRKLAKNVEILKEMGIDEDKEKRDAFFKNLKEKKKVDKQRLLDALNDESNPRFIVDCSFEQHMGLQEKKSLAMQLQIIVGDQKRYEHPFAIHLVNLKDQESKKQIDVRNGSKWPVKIMEEAMVVDDKTVYLSPDS